MSSSIPPFEKILAKGSEYRMLARHVNVRGITELFGEINDLIKGWKAQGYSFDDLMLDIEAKLGARPDLTRDKFLASVKKLWSDDGTLRS
jgi:hypothetical protein